VPVAFHCVRYPDCDVVLVTFLYAGGVAIWAVREVDVSVATVILHTFQDIAVWYNNVRTIVVVISVHRSPHDEIHMFLDNNDISELEVPHLPGHAVAVALPNDCLDPAHDAEFYFLL